MEPQASKVEDETGRIEIEVNKTNYPECPNPDCTESRVAINQIGGGAANGGHTYYCYGCSETFD